MYVTNKDEAIPLLRQKLPDYLKMLKVITHEKDKFLCPIHDDHTPSMILNPKSNYEVAHCFSCNATLDIFRAANVYEGYAETGAEWMTETIPELGNKLGVIVETGEPSPQDKEKLILYKLAQDIDDIISAPEYIATDYLAKRNWANELETASSIAHETLVSALLTRGWTNHEITKSLMVHTSKQNFFGEDKVTFTIRDFRGKPIAFVSRNLSDTGPKYINTTETLIYSKGKTLLGLDKAIQLAKLNGIFIVEGPGDRAQLLRLGIKNVVATCGTAFTADHMYTLRVLGIRDAFFCLDWDSAGTIATSRIFDEVLRQAPGVNCYVIEAPPDMGELNDPDAYLAKDKDAKRFLNLKAKPAFDWVMENTSNKDDPAAICARMIPIIASEGAAVKRELLIERLQEYTGVSYQAISADVNSIREGETAERRKRLLAAADKHRLDVERDPENIIAAMSIYESEVQIIEQDYERDIIGVNYQLSRFDAIQELKKRTKDGQSNAGFTMKYFQEFSEALSGGMIWSTGTLIYVPGHGNSGKTALVIMLGLDVLMHDENSIVIMHFTDDPYELVEPRIKTNLSRLLGARQTLSIGEAADPEWNIRTNTKWAIYNEADRKFREYIAQEKLIVIDSSDGSTLSALERVIRYTRQKNPTKKILVVCDNTHNYSDFGHLGSTERMAAISTGQKRLCTKYKTCMIATAEYRKGLQRQQADLVWPKNEDIADSRALVYRPNAIVHVYNDLNERGDYAEYFWIDASDPETPLPTLLLIFGKNKITSFKKSLALNLDPNSVTLIPSDIATVRANYESYTSSEGVTIMGGRLMAKADEYTKD